jgi:hypothetical protein
MQNETTKNASKMTHKADTRHDHLCNEQLDDGTKVEFDNPCIKISNASIKLIGFET